MKKLFLILAVALSLTAVAQEKKTITIQQPNCKSTMVAKLVYGTLTREFLKSEEWQLIARPSDEDIKRSIQAGEPVGDMPKAQYVLVTEILEDEDICFVECKIIDTETAVVVNSAMEMTEQSPKSIQETCVSLAKQLLKEQKQ
ncbi:MAG: hypothetical protein J6Y00_05570 [Paludibacteraceae bacterium]|nr:hypothetical protein [Paludibacteraceae bacterium]